MTCLNNSITTLDQDNMYRFRFLLSNDFSKLKKLLEERIEIWAKDWSFSSNIDIHVEKISILKFELANTTFFQKVGDASYFFHCIDSEFNWAKFAFDEYYVDCPKDELLTQLSHRIKNSFFLDVFGFTLKENAAPVSLKKFSFKDLMKIEVIIPSVGKIVILSHESVFHTLLNDSSSKLIKTGLSRLNAIKDMKITANISINFGEVAFLDLIGIDKNKVIRSTESIDNRFKFKINDNPVFNVALGKVENTKSIIVQGVSK